MASASFINILHTLDFAQIFRVMIIIIAGFLLARVASHLTYKLLSRIGRLRYSGLICRIIFYTIFALFVCSALIEMGFNLHVLLGAAGIFTVAIGLASQMSFSNFISGLFLMGEGAIHVGDTITIDGTNGDIVSMDLLSIKLKTAENAYIRIPNEVLIKTQISNFSRFPIRRLDLKLHIGLKEAIEPVRQILLTVANNNYLCLKTPAPQIVVTDFAESGIVLRYSLWVNKENYQEL